MITRESLCRQRASRARRDGTAPRRSNEVNIRMQEAEITSIEVNKTSEEYRPVAKRASLLYFCLADMANVDPMYQCVFPRFEGLGCLHAVEATRLRQRRRWVVFGAILRLFGPNRRDGVDAAT
jgi:hypothetical protein